MIEDVKKLFQSDNAVVKIIIINIAAFVLFNLMESLFPTLRLPLRNIFWLPSDVLVFLLRPWTLISYMFLHGSLGHIIYNLLALYWFGRIFSDFLGTKRFLGLYLLGGLAGGAFYIIVYNLFLTSGQNIPLVGASAAVMAIVVAAGLRFPDFQMNLLLFGPVQLKWIALALFILSTVLDLNQNFGGKMAHLGGAAVGFAYVRTLNRGTDFALGFYGWIDRILARLRKRRTPVMKASKGGAFGANATRLTSDEIQRKTDSILDKISKSGYENLTKEEKDFLFKVSNRQS